MHIRWTNTNPTLLLRNYESFILSDYVPVSKLGKIVQTWEYMQLYLALIKYYWCTYTSSGFQLLQTPMLPWCTWALGAIPAPSSRKIKGGTVRYRFFYLAVSREHSQNSLAGLHLTFVCHRDLNNFKNSIHLNNFLITKIDITSYVLDATVWEQHSTVCIPFVEQLSVPLRCLFEAVTLSWSCQTCTKVSQALRPNRDFFVFKQQKVVQTKLKK